MRRYALFAILVLCCIFAVSDAAYHPNKNRKHRSMPIYPPRNENSSAMCGPREYHVMCGPERHCDMSCDNLYSPPNCYFNPLNPKCHFPRCLCKAGFARDVKGRCIRPSRCPQFAYNQQEGSGEEGDTRTQRHSHLRSYRRKAHRRRRPETYFW